MVQRSSNLVLWPDQIVWTKSLCSQLLIQVYLLKMSHKIESLRINENLLGHHLTKQAFDCFICNCQHTIKCMCFLTKPLTYTMIRKEEDTIYIISMLTDTIFAFISFKMLCIILNSIIHCSYVWLCYASFFEYPCRVCYIHWYNLYKILSITVILLS